MDYPLDLSIPGLLRNTVYISIFLFCPWKDVFNEKGASADSPKDQWGHQRLWKSDLRAPLLPWIYNLQLGPFWRCSCWRGKREKDLPFLQIQVRSSLSPCSETSASCISGLLQRKLAIKPISLYPQQERRGEKLPLQTVERNGFFLCFSQYIFFLFLYQKLKCKLQRRGERNVTKGKWS